MNQSRLLSVCVVVSWTSAASADGGLRVLWKQANPSEPPCLSRDAVESSVHRALEREVFVQDQPNVILESSVSVPQHTLKLRLFDKEGRSLGRRLLRGESCEELTSTAALVLSLMLDFDQEELAQKVLEAEAQAAAEAEAQAAAEAEAQAAAKSAEPKPPQTVPPARQPERVNEPLLQGAMLVAQGHVRSGFAPGLTLGLGVSAGIVLRGNWSISAAGSFWPTQSFEVNGGALRTRRWQLGLDACVPPLVRGWFAATACIDTQFAFAAANTSGFDLNRPQQSVAILPGALLRLSGGSDSVFLRLDLGANYAARRYRLVLVEPASEQSLFLMPAFSLGGSFGLGLRF